MSESVRHAPRRASLWSRASAIAARTPPARNRLVDFLRAASILAVISGHWLLAAPYVSGTELALGNMLERSPWTQWLTWAFQVMPIFFLVGGYANGVSWRAAARDARSYREWLTARLQRLVGPVLPLIAVWAFLGAAGGQLGVPPDVVQTGSRMALVPIWFLAVYTLVVVLVPLSHAAWMRFGFVSFFLPAGLAVVDDALFFFADLRAAGWLNYAFVWLAVHQLGYAWLDGRLGGASTRLACGLAGLGVLAGLVTIGPHPLSMISVPGEGVSNSLPPKLPMLALGVAQSGLLLSLEGPLRRWLVRSAPWTATVLLNGMIMTIYLWHLTAAALVMGLAILLGNVGLDAVPGTASWWLTRPVWLVLYIGALGGLALVLGRFERGAESEPAAAWRQVAGAAVVCAGLAMLALNGVGGDGWLGLRLWALALPFIGAALAGLLPVDVPWRPGEAAGARQSRSE